MSDTTLPFERPVTTSAPVRQMDGPRLQTLVRLRWLAVAGQLAAVLLVHLGLEFPLPLVPCLFIIALSAWLNIFLSMRWRTSLRLRERFSALMLGYDILQLAVLLYLTGGLQNPFCFLFLVPVTVSAAMLPLNRTIWLAGLAFISICVLAVYHLPLPWSSQPTLVLPPLYIAGMWVALTSGLSFAALYAGRIAMEAREMSQALAATEAVLAHEQQLHALDGLAAAAAHELGTPLATISVVAKELKKETADKGGAMDEDLDLLVSQAERCRDILSRLAQRDCQSDAMFAKQQLPVMIEEIIEPLRGPDVTIEVSVNPAVKDQDDIPVIPRSPGIRYGLTNLLENALDFANDHVTIDVGWDKAELSVTITDDGPGFALNIFERLGDPFVTSRRGYGSGALEAEPGGHQGMGLGFFIAKTLLERSGADVVLANRANPQHGAVVHITWPRASLETDG